MPTSRIVIKLGTSTLTGGTYQLNRQRILEVVQQIARLHQQGHEVIVVSSGAQAAGREKLPIPDLSRSLPTKQMLSAIGQSRLMQIYGDYFDIFNLIVAQILLTRDDLSIRMRYLNARDTLQTLLDKRIIPIINENDTIATDEIRVGDNDTLSALVASTLEADQLIMLTDQNGLYTADPRTHADAQHIPEVHHITPEIITLGGGAGSHVGTGGMATKLQAAQIATRSGVTVIIVDGKITDVLPRLLSGEALGTRFHATSTHLESRKRWLLTDRTQGAVHIDEGAVRALRASDGASLLPVGITRVQGTFKRSATLAIFSPQGEEIAHGLTNYDSQDLQRLLGHKSQDILQILGYSYGDAAIHRNNLVLLQPTR